MGDLLAGFQDEVVVVEQGQRIGRQLIQFGIAELQRGLGLARGLHLAQEVGDILGAKGAGGESFLEGLGHLLGAIGAEQIEQLAQLAGKGTVGVGQTAEISFHRLLRAEAVQQGEQALLRLGTPGGGTLSEQLFFKAFGAQGLAAPPATHIAHDFGALRVIQGHRGGIGLGNQVLAHPACRSTVAIGVEVPAQVLVDEDLGGVAVIGGERWQGPQTVGAEALAGPLAGFPMQAGIGDLLKLLSHLAIHIDEIGEGAQRPEIMAEVADAGLFNFSLFPSRPGIASTRIKTVFAGEGEEAGIKPHQAAVVFGDHGQQIIVPTFPPHPTQGFKGVLVAAHEGLKTLAMGELDVEHPAVGFDEAEGIELAFIALIVEVPKWPQSISKRSPGPGSMRTKARGAERDTRTCCKCWRRMVYPPE
jgi:hypothetical protein